MSDIALRVENLSKRYRIGKSSISPTEVKSVGKKVLSPFNYLVSTLREPNPDEIIWALKDVSFHVHQGEVVGIIGSNGAGKSTLLKILSRITEPTYGKAYVTGRIGSLLEVGTGFHPELTGRENIYLNGAILGMKREEIDRKYNEIVAFSEVEKFLDTPVKRYSSGMYVRLAFAVAAHLEPEILVVDEVLAVGDAAFQRKCLRKMGEVAKEGRTVLFVSHNMVAVQNLCSRVIWLNEGQIIEIGSVSEVVSKYLQTSLPTVHEQTWDDKDLAPGNEKVRLHRIRVRPDNGSTTDAITMQTSFVIEIDYWNLLPNTLLDVTLHIVNEQDIVVFGTSTTYERQWHNRPFPAGLFRSICRVPPDLLNSGTYRVTLLIVKDQGTIVYRHENLATFDVLELAERHTAWHGKLAGVVRPNLEWITEYLQPV